jgi:hypothetical protein
MKKWVEKFFHILHSNNTLGNYKKRYYLLSNMTCRSSRAELWDAALYHPTSKISLPTLCLLQPSGWPRPPDCDFHIWITCFPYLITWFWHGFIVVKNTYYLKFTTLIIFKSTVQWNEMYLQCCAAIITIHVHNSSSCRSGTPYHETAALFSFSLTSGNQHCVFHLLGCVYTCKWNQVLFAVFLTKYLSFNKVFVLI